MIVTIPEDLFLSVLSSSKKEEDRKFGFLKGRILSDKNPNLKFCEQRNGYQVWHIEMVRQNKHTKNMCIERDVIELNSKLSNEVSYLNNIIGCWFRNPNFDINFDQITNFLKDYFYMNKLFDSFGEDNPEYKRSRAHFLLAVISGEENLNLDFWDIVITKNKENDNTFEISKFNEIKKEIIYFKNDLFSRIQGIIDTDYLLDKTVAVVGLGTGGSLGALELAKCGVGKFKLIDFDILETHNITRHVCNLEDIGRFKTQAVRDLITKVNPFAIVDTYEININENISEFRKIVKQVDLVFAATDSESSKFLINKICFEENIPSVYGAAYERAFGGDVIRVIPHETPCYDCIMGKLIRELNFAETRKGIFDYSSIEDSTKITAEPGLGIDVAFIVLIQVKYALLTLLRNTESSLKDIPHNVCFWGNRPEWIFSEPFQCRFAETEIRPDCDTCGEGKFYEKELGIPKEVLAREEDIVVKEALKKEIKLKRTE
jgi:molybdopterin/thiamine biosynthesis adenylyltransferase